MNASTIVVCSLSCGFDYGATCHFLPDMCHKAAHEGQRGQKTTHCCANSVESPCLAPRKSHVHGVHCPPSKDDFPDVPEIVISDDVPSGPWTVVAILPVQFERVIVTSVYALAE